MLTKKETKRIRMTLLKLDMSYADIARKFYTSKQMVSMAVRKERDSDLAVKIRSYVDKLLSEQEVGL